MVKLLKLEKQDFTIFKSWISNANELSQFAGPILKFPVTDEQLENYINDERRISLKVVLIETSKMIGHCELNFENPLPRLSRVLVGDKTYRNKGLGKQIINAMLRKLFIDDDFEKADLNVFDWNTGAIKCYERVGFEINPDISQTHLQNGIPWTAINMTISKEKWLRANNR